MDVGLDEWPRISNPNNLISPSLDLQLTIVLWEYNTLDVVRNIAREGSSFPEFAERGEIQ